MVPLKDLEAHKKFDDLNVAKERVDHVDLDQNAGHSLRIPEAAIPWDSGFLVNRGDHFEVRLTVPGVYDYYCQPHEAAGMVGRIVGRPVGPGAMPFDCFQRRSGTETWKPVPEA